jgi:hypothetical protein
MESVALIAVLLAWPAAACAQTLYGSMVGDVTDASGAAVPGATVTILHQGTGLSRQTTTSGVGAYSFPSIATGAYDLEVSAPGMAKYRQTGIPVTINNVTRVNVKLELSAVSESIVVSAAAAILQSDRAEVRSEIGSKELTNLPVPVGRNYQQLFRTLPGFRPPANAHSVPSNPSRALTFNVNGASQSTNNTRIDGATSSNPHLPHLTGYVPALEAIETVNVVSNSFDAEQGLAGGAAINVQIKSGTNSVHGSAFEYHTNQKLKAKPWTAPPGERNPKLVYNQFGGTVGGPLRKDKLFYFLSYEGTLDRRNASLLATVPTAAIKAGDMSESPRPIYDPASGDATGANRLAFPLNAVPASRQSSIALKIAGLTPLPNLAGLTSNYYATAPFLLDRHTVDSKVNWNVSNRLTMFGRFGLLHFDTDNPQAFGEGVGGPPIAGGATGKGDGNTYSMTFAGTYVFDPRFVLDANFGYTRFQAGAFQPRLDENVGRDLLGIPGTNGTRRFEGGWPRFQISNYTNLGISEEFAPQWQKNPHYQYVANFSWTKEAHEIRFGSDIFRLKVEMLQPQITGAPQHPASGGFTFAGGPTQIRGGPSGNQFNSYAAFLLGLPTELGRTVQVPDTYKHQSWSHSFYVRDRWSVTPKLSVSYGVRYEYFPFPRRQDRGLERYDPATNNMLVCGVGTVPIDCGVRVSKKLFAPRLGIAYRVTDSLVGRAGYGITHNPFPIARALRTNYPVVLVLVEQGANSFLPAGTLAQGIPSVTVPELGNGVLEMPKSLGANTVRDYLDRGYTQSWNFTLQSKLKFGFTGQAGYVATRETHQMGVLDVNAGQVIGTGQSGRPLFRQFGRTAFTRVYQPLGTGQYNALQATAERRFSSSLGLGVSYTWSKTIGFTGSADGTVPVNALAYFDRNRTLLDYDRTHMLHVTNLWDLPFGKGRRWLSNGGAAALLLSGWQVNNILSLLSGTPFSVTASATSLDMPGSSQTADQVKREVRKLGGAGRGQSFFDPFAFQPVTQARFGTAGINSLRGPGVVNWDFGVFREFRMREHCALQFRAEAFNFSNTPHFANPGGNVSNMTLNSDGTIRSLGGYTEITNVINLGRDGVDERQFRFGLRFSW